MDECIKQMDKRAITNVILHTWNMIVHLQYWSHRLISNYHMTQYPVSQVTIVVQDTNLSLDPVLHMVAHLVD